MISPLKTSLDNKRYDKLGSSYEIVHINRPSFVLLGKKIEFDFSPKPWMLNLMRHLRLLRVLMPDWHREERAIAEKIRALILGEKLPKKKLLELDHVKGYREVRYQSARKFLGE
jgi:indolepyruvate ferredoxin oxidoreductase